MYAEPETGRSRSPRQAGGGSLTFIVHRISPFPASLQHAFAPDPRVQMSALPTGIYNFAWSGGTFEVQLRARNIFWCP